MNKNKSKTLTRHFLFDCNVNLMVKNVVQIKCGVLINARVSVKTR